MSRDYVHSLREWWARVSMCRRTAPGPDPELTRLIDAACDAAEAVARYLAQRSEA